MKADRPVILGVGVDALTVPALNARIGQYVEGRSHALVLSANAHALNLAYQNPWLRSTLNAADLVICDGMGVRYASYLLGSSIPERITKADWVWSIAGFAAQRGYSFFFLGSAPGVADLAASSLRQRYPTLRVLGTHHGYFDHQADSPENQAVLRAINNARPDILIVGMGMPLQERWLAENWPHIDAHVGMTGGAVFDYVAGRARRSPQWLNRLGFEWLGRLIIEPRRLWRRYLLGNPIFLWRVIRQRLNL